MSDKNLMGKEALNSVFKIKKIIRTGEEEANMDILVNNKKLYVDCFHFGYVRPLVTDYAPFEGKYAKGILQFLYSENLVRKKPGKPKITQIPPGKAYYSFFGKLIGFIKDDLNQRLGVGDFGGVKIVVGGCNGLKIGDYFSVEGQLAIYKMKFLEGKK